MSPPWNNAVRPSNSSPGDRRDRRPQSGRPTADRGAPSANSWDSWSAADHQTAHRRAGHAPGGSRVKEPRGRRLEAPQDSKSWDDITDKFGGLAVTGDAYNGGTVAGGGWAPWPSPNAGGWANPPGMADNSGGGAGWRAWPSRQAGARVDQEVEHEPDPFGLEVNNADNNGINFDAYEDIPVEVTGDGVPPPASSFADIDLGRALTANIQRCKYVKPTPIQRHAIPIAVAGRDLMACAQTGSGKTAAFCFPIIAGILKNGLKVSRRSSAGGSGRRELWQAACPVALILAPTRELCCQIHEEAKKFAYQTGVKVVVAYGGAPVVNQLYNLEKGVDILVATPGRLIDIIERGRVSLSKIHYLTLDEADRMLDMGFEHQVRKIVEQMDMPTPGMRQTMLFSATFPDEIQKLASEFLSNSVFLTIGRVGSSADLITQRVEFVDDIEKRNHLRDILISQNKEQPCGKNALTLVFVQTKKGADSLEKWLSRNGFSATAIHGDKVQIEREWALKSFKSGATPVLVATDVAARGLDVPSVAHVINFDLPTNIDDYVHRIGRTGRAGKSGLATAFFSDRNTPIAKALLDLMEEANQEVPSWLHEYAERSSLYGGSSGSRQRYQGGSFDRFHGFSPSDDDPHYSYEPTYAGDAAGSSHIATYDYGSIVPTGWD